MNWLLKFDWLRKFFAWFQGRTTTFCILFFIMGNILQYQHRLDMTYITFMGTLMGIIVGHSVKEDYFNTKVDEPHS
jgi:hypothetical protein